MSETKLDDFITETSVNEEPIPAEQESAGKSATESATAAEDAVEDADNKEEIVAEEADKEADKDAEKSAKPKKTAAERIAELTKKRHDAERAASEKDATISALEERLAALEGKKSSEKGLTPEKEAAKSEDKAPDPEDFEYGELDSRYHAAREEHLLKKARAEARAELDSFRQAEAAAKRAQEVKQKFDSQIAKGVEEFEDFEESLAAVDSLPPVDQSIAEAILESEVGHKIIDYLAKNKAEASSMASKSPIEQARFLGKLEAQFSSKQDAPKKQEIKTSKAPAPIDRVRGTDGKYTVPPDTDDFAAFERQYGNPKRG